MSMNCWFYEIVRSDFAIHSCDLNYFTVGVHWGLHINHPSEKEMPRLDPPPAGLEVVADAARTFQGPVVAGGPPVHAVPPGHPRLDQGVVVLDPPVAGGLHADGLVGGDAPATARRVVPAATRWPLLSPSNSRILLRTGLIWRWSGPERTVLRTFRWEVLI